jgi:hypothetical protein
MASVVKKLNGATITVGPADAPTIATVAALGSAPPGTPPNTPMREPAGAPAKRTRKSAGGSAGKPVDKPEEKPALLLNNCPLSLYKPAGPVANAFIHSDAFVAAIRGPLGSGKSTACVYKLFCNLDNQRPLEDGWRRRRTAVIRNTYVVIASTTDGTWVNGRFQIPRGMVRSIKPLRKPGKTRKPGGAQQSAPPPTGAAA